MTIGMLRHKIQILQKREVMTGQSGTSVTYSIVTEPWADVKQVSGYVTFDTKQIDEKVTHKIKIRYRPFVTSENFIRFKKRLYRVRSVENEEERDRWLFLLCEMREILLDSFIVDTSSVDDSDAQVN
jgi:SPP1 family predicted phage head-tail adaptor